MSAIPREERIRFVGASEVATVAGQNPFDTRYRLWCEKRGLVEPDDLTDKPAVLIGQAIEAFTAERWAAKNGLKVRPYNEHHVHRDCPRYASSFDYITEDGELVECKAPGWKAWRAWGERPTLAHEIQLQAEMDCGRGHVADRGWLVILPLGEGVDPVGFPYDARTRVQGRLLSEVEDFWRSIDRNEPPEPDFERDASAVVAARKALIGGDGLLPTPYVTPDPQMAAKLSRHKELGADIRALEGERRGLSAEILLAMGDHKTMLAGDMKASIALIGDKLIEQHVRKGYPRLTIGKAPRR